MDKLFIIVKGGRVEEIYSTKTETELYAEILDFDSMERTEEMEKDQLICTSFSSKISIASHSSFLL